MGRLLSALSRVALALARRDIREPVSFFMVLRWVEPFFNVTIGYYLARLVHDNRGIVGGDYFTFALIGIAFTQFIWLGYNAFGEQLLQASRQGTLAAIWMTPTPWLWIAGLTAMRVFAIAAGSVALTLMLGARLCHAPLVVRAPGGVMVVMLLTGLTMGGLGLCSAALALAFRRNDPVRALLTRLFVVFGGVFVPVALFPAWVQAVAYSFPFTHSLAALRVLLTGGGWGEMRPALTALALMTAVWLPLGVWAIGWALERMRRTGALVLAQ